MVTIVGLEIKEIWGTFLFSSSTAVSETERMLGERDSMECYSPSAVHSEGELILHFPVSPFHKYDILIFILPHALSFWKEITWGFTVFSPSYFPIRIPSFANNKLFVARGFAAKF